VTRDDDCELKRDSGHDDFKSEALKFLRLFYGLYRAKSMLHLADVEPHSFECPFSKPLVAIGKDRPTKNPKGSSSLVERSTARSYRKPFRLNPE
jgi:hypothetical protein